MYRDVKPENVGFDVRDDVKIFDFDLIREYPETSHNGTYQLTGQTGSTIYMAPEVALGKPYNETIDVYSFSILLWQILHMEMPFQNFTQHMFDNYVVKNGARPKCDAKVGVSTELSNLMSRGWHADWRQRPSMEDVAQGLRDEIHRHAGKVVEENRLSGERSDLSSKGA